MERYKRHLSIENFDSRKQEKIKNAKVLIAGLGGLGSFVLYNLASIGILNLGLVEFDKVDITNFNRQIIYNFSDLGKEKIARAKENILKFNPDLKIETFNKKLDEDNVDEIIKNYDIIIDCLDNYKGKFLLNDSCLKFDRTLIFGGVEEFSGQIAVIDKKSACLRCIFPDFDLNKPVKKGIISPVVSEIASIQAMEAFKIITNDKHILYNTLLTIDFKKTEYKKLWLGKKKLCRLH